MYCTVIKFVIKINLTVIEFTAVRSIPLFILSCDYKFILLNKISEIWICYILVHCDIYRSSFASCNCPDNAFVPSCYNETSYKNPCMIGCDGYEINGEEIVSMH